MKTWLRRTLAALLILAVPTTAWAYKEYILTTGETVGVAVMAWLNGSGQAQAVSASAPLPVSSPDFTGTGSVTKSSATTGYTVGELFNHATSGPATITPIQVTPTAGGSGYITHAHMEDSGTGGSAPPGYTIYLFSAAPTVASIYDYQAYVNPYAADITAGTYLGSLTCSSFAKTNDSTAQWTSPCQSTSSMTPAMFVQALSNQTYVDALVTVNGSYTPIASEVLTIVFNISRSN